MNEFRHVFLPYCIEQQADGRWAVLNRRYKPVGMTTREFVTYADPHLVKLKGLGPSTKAKLCAPGSHCSDKKIWLYNDGCIPTDAPEHWDAYQQRLQLLARLTIES